MIIIGVRGLDAFHRVRNTRRLKFDKITERLLNDSLYAQLLMKIPVDRMSSVRGPLYDASRDIVWEKYGLKAIEHDGAELKKAVRVLLSGNRFICPGKLSNGKYTDFKADLPFCAPAIIEIASTLFFCPDAVTPLADEFFTSSIKTGVEATQREIPEVMAALLATIAGAAIHEGLHGVRATLRKNGGFNADTQVPLYAVHLQTLKELSAIGRHKILGYLFKTAKVYHVQAMADKTKANTLVNPATAGMSIIL
ncbi:uncharacterized protein C8Q71DRAFT_726825 [Rhodofomes roseus]|uniref:DUF6532 domain-containing protein n=1 Tax=Rhodofomes roseus TaxID=34475 RepID=A0ABQ8K493_9APHY|nr:uncharacterized protein C8Q71DRAFT_726825 [Rhodofomes roseus]KAH9831668.1 hypothetical protein C8Q71DRAFT_726825 [Rhodofomes roseus]